MDQVPSVCQKGKSRFKVMGSTLFFWCVFCVLRGQQRRGGLDPFHPGAATSLCLPDRFSIYYVLLAKNSWEEQKMETDRFSLDVTAMMAAAAQKRRKGGSIIDPTPRERERRAKWESSSRQPSSLASPVQSSAAQQKSYLHAPPRVCST